MLFDVRPKRGRDAIINRGRGAISNRVGGAISNRGYRVFDTRCMMAFAVSAQTEARMVLSVIVSVS